ncbi:siderophore-interacting protein [Actinomadura macrotermitis]|uniref:FAD-binding FR-type domain-containing protein n=1 Tax=Actinomadura macrotermitis TaxID=2585200 RepID=A0A7K0C5W4_9ACTN|nr:siderophore-interacting protein [Actinomadura macrotermitis]MQY08840.1 hypothetical protein [Actinomadura macrotermitis]
MAPPLPVTFVTVTRVERLTPHMRRVVFAADDLPAILGTEPDQQVKLYFPKPGQARPRLPEPGPDGDLMSWYQAYNDIPEDERPWMRSYTIRAHDPQARTVVVDFVLHPDGGPATRWAYSAEPGDTLGMFGPAEAFARPVPLSASIAEAGWLLLAGDATAVPAIGTLLEWLPEGARALAYIEIGDPADEQRLATRGDAEVHWIPAGTLLEAVRAARFPEGPVFAWLGGEAGTVRALRRHLTGERGVPKDAIDFTGFWRRRLSQDDAPTEEDLAEARERLAAQQA